MRQRFIAVWVVACVFWWSASFGWAFGTQSDSGKQFHAHHSCCPHAHVPNAPDRLLSLLRFFPGGMPCGGEHPCCAYRSPENRSSLPTFLRIPGADRIRSSSALIPQKNDARAEAAADNRTVPDYSRRSMVLLI